MLGPNLSRTLESGEASPNGGGINHSPKHCYNYSKVSLELNSKISLPTNYYVSLQTNSKVEMVNIFEGGGGEQVKRYFDNIIFKIQKLIFSDFSKTFLHKKPLLVKRLTMDILLIMITNKS